VGDAAHHAAGPKWRAVGALSNHDIVVAQRGQRGARASATEGKLAAALGRSLGNQRLFLGGKQNRLSRIRHLCSENARRKDAG
jgi:hypothetical protein